VRGGSSRATTVANAAALALWPLGIELVLGRPVTARGSGTRWGRGRGRSTRCLARTLLVALARARAVKAVAADCRRVRPVVARNPASASHSRPWLALAVSGGNTRSASRSLAGQRLYILWSAASTAMKRRTGCVRPVVRG